MSKKEILFVLILIFVCGFISSQLAELSIPQYAVPFMAMVGGFIAVALNRLKHLDDLNLTRKKDAALEYIKYFSEYRSALLNLIDPSVKDDLFHSNLMDATRNMVASLDKFHVVSSDSVSEKIEIKNAEVIKLMMDFRAKSTEFSEDKKSLLRWFIDEDIGSKLNTIRHEIITLINTEVGDGSGTTKLKSAIDSNNADFKNLFSKLLK